MNGQKTYFLYAGETLLGELNPDGTVKCYNTWGQTGLLARTQPATGQTTWYQYDALGNVAERLSASRKVLSSDQYDAWGNLVAGGDVTDPVGYKGQFGYYTDHETGLLLCTHRYNDPMEGRWITQDPIDYLGGLNLYRYCANNTLVQIDPYGYEGFGLEIGGIVDVNVGNAAYAINGSVGIGVFWGGGDINVGYFASGGMYSRLNDPFSEVSHSVPSIPGSNNWVNGIFGGAGVSGFIPGSNVHNAGDLGGPFTTYNLNGGIGPALGGQYSTDGTHDIISFPVPLPSFGAGIAASQYPTNTGWTGTLLGPSGGCSQ